MIKNEEDKSPNIKENTFLLDSYFELDQELLISFFNKIDFDYSDFLNSFNEDISEGTLEYMDIFKLKNARKYWIEAFKESIIDVDDVKSKTLFTFCLLYIIIPLS